MVIPKWRFYQADPRGKLPTVVEGSPIGNRCHHGSCDHRTNAFYSSDLLAECVAAVDLLNPLFHGRDALLQCAQFLVESAQKLSAESTQQRVVFLDQHGGSDLRTWLR